MEGEPLSSTSRPASRVSQPALRESPPRSHSRPEIADNVCGIASMPKLTRITRDARVMGGKPCIRGMRVTVGTVVGLVAAGRTREEIFASIRAWRLTISARRCPTPPGVPRKSKSRWERGKSAGRLEASLAARSLAPFALSVSTPSILPGPRTGPSPPPPAQRICGPLPNLAAIRPAPEVDGQRRRANALCGAELVVGGGSSGPAAVVAADPAIE
jgi:hypothetical protein